MAVARRGGSSQRKRRQPRTLVRRILVVTEGEETEPQYVELLDTYLRSRESTTVVKRVGVGKDPLSVVRKCIELRKKAMRADPDKAYNECVALVDVDNHASLDEASLLARQESIMLVVSNLKFEVWLRWHAEDKRSVLSTTQLDDRVRQLGLVKGKHLTPTFPIHKVHDAYAAARQADPKMSAGRRGPEPSSAMPLLVDLLRGRQSTRA